MANTFSTLSCKVFASWKINVIYLFFCNDKSTVFCGKFFLLPCYMTCYNFCKLVKSKDRFRNFAISKFRNFAISKMDLFVSMVQGFQPLNIVINISMLDLKTVSWSVSDCAVIWPRRYIFSYTKWCHFLSTQTVGGWIYGFSKTEEPGKQLRAILWEQKPWFWQKIIKGKLRPESGLLNIRKMCLR